MKDKLMSRENVMEEDWHSKKMASSKSAHGWETPIQKVSLEKWQVAHSKELVSKGCLMESATLTSQKVMLLLNNSLATWKTGLSMALVELLHLMNAYSKVVSILETNKVFAPILVPIVLTMSICMKTDTLWKVSKVPVCTMKDGAWSLLNTWLWTSDIKSASMHNERWRMKPTEYLTMTNYKQFWFKQLSPT